MTPVPASVDVLLALLLGWAVYGFLLGWHLSNYQVFSLVAGVLGPLIAVAVLGLNFAEGSPFVAMAYAVALLAIGRRVGARPDAEELFAEADNVHLPSQN